MKGRVVMHAYQKSAAVQIKAADDESGIVEALVATYAVDSGGDKIVPGAFTSTLDEWAQSGNPIPFIWSHLHDDIDAYLGDVLEAKEVDDGLYIKAQIDMSEPKSAKAYRLLKSGRVHNYSFAYDVRDSGPNSDDENITELRELGLFEVGPTLIGMNRETRTLAVKHDSSDVDDVELKIGRVLSASTEQKLRDAHEAIAAVLAQLDEADAESSDEGKSHAAEPVKLDERESAKSDEPMQTEPDVDLALSLLLAKGMGQT
jgi:HK97 family phage prohead protease